MVESIRNLTENGWNVHIECKGKGREFELTYEATMRKVLGQDCSQEERMRSVYTNYHAVGDTLHELGENLLKTLSNR